MVWERVGEAGKERGGDEKGPDSVVSAFSWREWTWGWSFISAGSAQAPMKSSVERDS